MERLTEIRGDTVYYTGKHAKLPGLDCANTMRVAAIRDVMQRLADYEATGLEPEQIKKHQPQIVAVQKKGRAIMFNCCRQCTAPKRHPGCHDHCKEYKEARADFDQKKAADDRRTGRATHSVYAQKIDRINKVVHRLHRKRGY